MRRILVVVAILGGGVCLYHATAAAQTLGASISGVVQDSTGAVLPAVTAEASSPALIEKTRVGVTDSAGRYTILNLNPGTYSVTFVLPGFNTVRREGVVLEGTVTVQVNAELRVGSIEETVTVTGETPVGSCQ